MGNFLLKRMIIKDVHPPFLHSGTTRPWLSGACATIPTGCQGSKFSATGSTPHRFGLATLERHAFVTLQATLQAAYHAYDESSQFPHRLDALPLREPSPPFKPSPRGRGDCIGGLLLSQVMRHNRRIVPWHAERIGPESACKYTREGQCCLFSICGGFSCSWL